MIAGYRNSDGEISRLARSGRRFARWIAVIWLAACSSQAVELPPRGELFASLRMAVPTVPSLTTIVAPFAERTLDEQEQPQAQQVEEAPPYVCERFELRVREGGRVWHKRLRQPWTEADRKRFRALVRLVAAELGADPRLLTLWALRESTYNPYAIHVLDPDVEGSIASWRRHRWDPERAAELEATMDRLGARDPGYWEAKAELARISRFRGNRHYEAKISYELVARDRTRHPGERSAWSYGYGPFGFNPTYFLPIWDAAAPPWVFCNDDGLAAIVTAIWAAREHQRECEALGYGGSYAVVNRRFSSGHCDPRPQRAHKFVARAEARGIDPDARARLGDRWPADTSERAQLLEHLRAKAAEEGLLSGYAEADSIVAGE